MVLWGVCDGWMDLKSKHWLYLSILLLSISSFSSSHVGCECSASWEGPHCEYQKGTFYDVEEELDVRDTKTLGMGLGLVAAFLLVGLLGFLYCKHRREAAASKKRKKQQRAGLPSGARRAPHGGEII
jgi:hypothetical protein